MVSERPRKLLRPRVEVETRRKPPDTMRPAPVRLVTELLPMFMTAIVVDARVDEARVALVRRAWPKSCVTPVTPKVDEAFNAPLKLPVVPVIAPRLAVVEKSAVAVSAVEEALFKVARVETLRLVILEEPAKKVVAERIEVEALPKVARPVCVLVPDTSNVGVINRVPSNVNVVDVASEFVALV